ncbi:MAG: hypothetical protein HW401_322, partial [Parcubacteria group bacterium]|nr:hypothetical protein [Parcubacteria group bacterium]
MKKIPKKTDTSWGNIADWYDEMLEEKAHTPLILIFILIKKSLKNEALTASFFVFGVPR